MNETLKRNHASEIGQKIRVVNSGKGLPDRQKQKSWNHFHGNFCKKKFESSDIGDRKEDAKKGFIATFMFQYARPLL